MNYKEEAIGFSCEGEDLLGILARPERPSSIGVVAVVGGPQTRVGSHRQFVLLSRELALAGYPTLRFDYRGMGDSSGEKRNFETVTPDTRAAIDALCTACPQVSKVILWGLCDAAAACLLFWDDTHDPRIAGLCLLNPWVHSEATLARTQVKHYYGQRLLRREFWLKLLSGRINAAKAIGEFVRKIGQASRSNDSQPASFQARMAHGWRNFPGPILLLLSGNDYTAKEFLEYTASAEPWHGALGRANTSRVDIADADHAFSCRKWRGIVEQALLQWLEEAFASRAASYNRPHDRPIK